MEYASAMENLVAVDLVIVAIGYTEAADMVVHVVQVALLVITYVQDAALTGILVAHAVQVVLMVITQADDAALIGILVAHAVQDVLLVIT